MRDSRRFVLLVWAGLLFAVAPSAQAAFPGANGRINFSSDAGSATGNGDVYDMRSDGSGQRNLTNNPAEDFYGHYSPDGRRIAFTSFRDAGDAQDDVRNHAELYVMDADGSHQRRITFNQLPEKNPSWSPDGKHLVFWRSARITTVGDELPPGDLWIVNLETGQTRSLFKKPMSDEDVPQWSPDGGRIAFDSAGEFGGEFVVDIYTIRPDGRDLRLLTRTSEDFDYSPNYSPDGRRITFTREHDGNGDIFVMSADGSHPIQLTDDIRYEWESCFSPDGRFIAYTSEVGGAPFPGEPGFFFFDIFVMRADGSAQTRLTKTPAIDEVRPDWQPLPRHP